MRLFGKMFLTLAGQALIAAVLPGGLLVWNTYMGQQIQMAQRDREALDGFAATAGEALRAGRPIDRLIPELDARDPERLGGRVQIARPDGFPVAGPTSNNPPIAERPIQVDGKTVAIARIVREPRLTDDDKRYLASQYLGIGAVVAGLFVLLLVIGYEIARRWSRPSQDLYRMSREVVRGEHEFEIDESGPPETVATMRNLRRIASQFNRLESARRTWLVSIADELKRPAEDLAAHLDTLKAQEVPINPELMAALEEDTHRFSQMAEDLAAVAAADLGRLPVNFQQVDPRALIHNAIYGNKKRAEAAGVELNTSRLPEYTILVRWDGSRIEQLFGALIENSLRYTPKRGKIVLGLESSRDAWRLIIDDTAPGVDVMLAQRLFEPFYRSSEGTDSAGASGLGLATARAIVEAHHGRIEASRSPIGGLRVTVILPAEPPRA